MLLLLSAVYTATAPATTVAISIARSNHRTVIIRSCGCCRCSRQHRRHRRLLLLQLQQLRTSSWVGCRMRIGVGPKDHGGRWIYTAAAVTATPIIAGRSEIVTEKAQ